MPVEYEIRPASRTRLNLAELWTYRELLYFFIWRDIKIKYKQTVLGALWAVLQPFLLMLVFTVFFSRALGLSDASLPYPVFVYSGLMLWNIFSTGVANAGNSMVANANIIKKIYFPRILIPVSSVLASLVDFMMTFLLFVGILIYYKVEIHWLNLAIGLPLSVLITLLATLGLGSLLSALNVKYRDFRYIIPFFLQVLFFVSPVIYPLNRLPWNWLNQLMQCNPLYGAIAIFRSAFDGSTPDAGICLISVTGALLLVITGLLYFRKTENYFADLS